MTDIFKFWSQVQEADREHPADREVLARVKHGFDLARMPGCFVGQLRTAPVVLLYLSPGWSEHGHVDRLSKSDKERAIRKHGGNEPIPDLDRPGIRWLASRTKCFGPWNVVRPHVAVLNIGAYHSKTFEDKPLLAALPSSRMSLSWAQDVLFPQAVRGERVVVCMRAARFWGLEVGNRYGEALFTPEVVRGGYMKRSELREQVIEAVKAAIAKAAERELVAA